MSSLRILRAPFMLLRRPAWWLLAWSQRHTLALWGRSLRAEAQRGRPVDVIRARRLVSTLLRVTTDPRLSNAPELRSLELDGDVVVAHTDEHWSKRPMLTSVLTGVSHVNEVRFA